MNTVSIVVALSAAGVAVSAGLLCLHGNRRELVPEVVLAIGVLSSLAALIAAVAAVAGGTEVRDAPFVVAGVFWLLSFSWYRRRVGSPKVYWRTRDRRTR